MGNFKFLSVIVSFSIPYDINRLKSRIQIDGYVVIAINNYSHVLDDWSRILFFKFCFFFKSYSFSISIDNHSFDVILKYNWSCKVKYKKYKS